MVEVLVEPCGQEAIILDNGCKLNDNPTEHLVRSDRCDLILEQSNLSPIQQFYNGQSIFITGGTGFVGKLLIEKLLRECPGISFIYLLVRPKKGKDMHQRIEEIFDDPVRILIFSPAFFFNLFRVLSNFFFLSLFFSSKQIPILWFSLVLLLLPALRIDHNTNSLSLDMPLSSHSTDHRYLATLFFFFLTALPYFIFSTILSSRYRSGSLQISR